eukprot:1099839-Pelagomonas_calceolata.AAC.2
MQSHAHKLRQVAVSDARKPTCMLPQDAQKIRLENSTTLKMVQEAMTKVFMGNRRYSLACAHVSMRYQGWPFAQLYSAKQPRSLGELQHDQDVMLRLLWYANHFQRK